MNTTPSPVPAPAGFGGSASSEVLCPACRAPLAAGARACSQCLADLTSAPAVRLWQVEQRLAAMEGERTSLIQEAARLRVQLVSLARVARSRIPGGAASVPVPAPSPYAPSSAPSPTPTPTPLSAAMHASAQVSAPTSPVQGAPKGTRNDPFGAGQEWRSAAPAAAASSIGGQQLLLGLGAFLLLSGMSVFLWMVWDLIGLLGQASVMLVATLAAAGGAAWATRRRLPAAAETAAVIASGLLALDVSAAWRLGLFGLDRVDGNLWFGIAGLAASGVLIGFDRLVPAHDSDGPLRRIVTYRPLAALTASLSAWNLFGIGDLDASAMQVSLVALLVAVAGFAVTFLAVRLDRRPEAGGWPVSAHLALLPALGALVVQVFAALFAGYGASPLGDRMVGAALLAVVPTVMAVAAVRGRTSHPQYAGTAAVVAVIGWCLVLGVPLWSAPADVLVVLAAAGSLALAGLSVARHLGGAGAWTTAMRDGLTILSVALWLVLLLLDVSGAESMVELVRGDEGGTDVAWWAPVVPLMGVLVARVVGVLREHHLENALLLQAVVLATALTALRGEGAPEIAWVATLWALACVALAWWAGGRSGSYTSTEAMHLVPAVFWGHVGLGAAVAVSTGAQVAVALALGAAFAVAACRPGRLLLGFVAVWFVSIAAWAVASDRGAPQVEMFTLVPGLGLFAMGLLMHRFAGIRSSVAIAGPALLVGFLPSVLASVSGEEVWRAVFVMVAGLTLLLLGCARGWLAPVVAGAGALAVVGWVQGGVLIAYLPGWSLLVGSGVLLLVVGVCWEASIKAGRRSASWIASLT